MTNLFKKVLTISALISGIGVAATASAAPVLNDFTVNNGTTTFTADKITGNYNEVFTVTGANTFATEAYWNAGQFVANDGATALAASATGLGSTYGLYAVFHSAGTFGGNVLGGTTFSGGSGTITVYLDTKNDSTFALPALGTGNTTVGNNGDDIPLATSTSLAAGEGKTALGFANGDFALLFDQFILTAAGKGFFIDPNPFYLQVVLKGQFNSFVPAGTQTINGSADAYFVPEPGTLAIVGLGLLAAGIARRRSMPV